MKTNLSILLLLFMILTSCSKDGYRVENGRVIYESPWNEGQGTVIRPLDADPSTFEVLGSDNLNWAKDHENVFWGYIELGFMDASSFEVLSVAFAKDNQHVICGKDIIIETNPREFELKSYMDKGIKHFYGVDKTAAYFCNEEANGYLRLPSNSIQKFEPLNSNFYIDGEIVRWGSHVVQDVQLTSFKVLGGNYATDGRNIFYTNEIVEGADVETFEVVKKDRAKDKNHRYEFEDRIE